MFRRMILHAARSPWFVAGVLAGLTAALLTNGLRPIAAQQPSAEGARENPEIKARLKCMRERAAATKPWLTAGGERKVMDGHPEPLFRLVDPTRNYPDGTLWAWPEKGRPAVLATLSLLANSEPPRWLYEFASLSDAPVGAAYGAGGNWSALRPGWEPKAFPMAPAPADSKPERLRQMRELARRFKAIELLPPPTEFELRLLPQPVLRYADEAAGQLDGAVFLLCHGTNPEIILTIEAKRETDKPAVWQYGFAPNSIAELRVTLDGAEVWTRPYVQFTAAYADGPYSIALQPADEKELREIEAAGQER